MTATSWAWAVHAYGPSRHLKATRCFPSRRNWATPLQTLLARKKNDLKPWLKEYWCLPSAPSGEFVWHMEDVLDVYTQPYDPLRPLVCLDETSKQLVAETRTPMPTALAGVAALPTRRDTGQL